MPRVWFNGRIVPSQGTDEGSIPFTRLIYLNLFKYMDLTLIIGTTGAALILIAFIMGQFHKWKDTDLIYDAVNFIGAILLIIYAVLIVSYPFMILNAVWAAVSLRDIFSDLSVRRPAGGKNNSDKAF